MAETFPLKYKNIELVGLDHGSFGRQCGIHSSHCGVAVHVGSVLKLLAATIEIPTSKQVAITHPIIPSDQPKKRGRPKAAPVEYAIEHTVEREETVKAFIWSDGVEGCCVGFVSIAFQSLYKCYD